MGYLVCDNCEGYYELQAGEKPEDFSDECECGGKLSYVETLEGIEEDIGESETIQDESVHESDDIERIYEDELLLNKKGKSIEEYGTGLRARSKRKELKIASDIQEIMDIKGYYTIKFNDDKSINVFDDGIETSDGQIIRFENIISIEDENISSTPSGEKSRISGLVSSGYNMFISNKTTLKIILDEGEIEFEDVKRSDAKKLISFVNRKIS